MQYASGVASSDLKISNVFRYSGQVGISNLIALKSLNLKDCMFFIYTKNYAAFWSSKAFLFRCLKDIFTQISVSSVSKNAVHIGSRIRRSL